MKADRRDKASAGRDARLPPHAGGNLRLDDLDLRARHGLFTGTASTCAPDLTGDVLSAGCFGVIDPSVIPLIFAHDASQPLGGWREIVERDGEVRVVGELNLEVARAREIFALMRRNQVGGLSVGFVIAPGGATLDRRTQTRTITRATLTEISLVCCPANPRARVDPFIVAPGSVAPGSVAPGSVAPRSAAPPPPRRPLSADPLLRDRRPPPSPPGARKRPGGGEREARAGGRGRATAPQTPLALDLVGALVGRRSFSKTEAVQVVAKGLASYFDALPDPGTRDARLVAEMQSLVETFAQFGRDYGGTLDRSARVLRDDLARPCRRAPSPGRRGSD